MSDGALRSPPAPATCRVSPTPERPPPRGRTGTSVLLPVSHLGALLYLRDGHAAQGDGELTGDAIETSMSVRFTVQIVRWGFQSNVRARDAESLMSLGVDGSLDEAMRMATSDRARWLGSEYRLDASEVAIVMGTAVQYDIPDVVPPAYGVVARVPLRALERVGESGRSRLSEPCAPSVRRRHAATSAGVQTGLAGALGRLLGLSRAARDDKHQACSGGRRRKSRRGGELGGRWRYWPNCVIVLECG